MVSIDFPTTFNASSSTHDDEIKKQRFRMTSHPRPTCGGERQGERVDGNDPRMNDYIPNVPSPDQQNDQEGHKSNTSQYDNAAWNKWLERLSDRSNAPNLQAYLAAKATRDNAKKKLEIALEECLQRLTYAMTEEMIADTVGVVYQEQGARFEALEASLVDVIKSNHIRRVELNRSLVDADALWGSLHKKLRTRLWNNNMMISSTSEDTAERLDGQIQKSIPNAEDGTTDPTWEEIAAFEPARDSVQTFLASREKLRLVDEALSQALDEIHDGLKADADAIVQVVVEFYDQFENETMRLEQDIQFHLMNNSERRDAFQKSLQESAKQAQGLIANLMSRLTSGM